jgi:predicted MFS family arabinose efflux permease
MSFDILKRQSGKNLSGPALVICLVCLFCHKYVKKPVRKVGKILLKYVLVYIISSKLICVMENLTFLSLARSFSRLLTCFYLPIGIFKNSKVI